MALSDVVIETSGLVKVYRSRHGRHTAVDRLDLAVPRGGVHGFLGPNGSGKTTTIRMLLGLIRPDNGQIRLFDAPVPKQLPQALKKIGAIVEQPRFFPTFTGRKNLVLLANTIGVPGAKVDEVLGRVGLTGRDRDKFKAYSLGMRQRLAIAAALLCTPELLILDEPTNGLDPAGIREIRNLITDLGSSGVTVLLSSHLLSEVQQVCDSVSIIGRGRLLASGPVGEVVGGPRSARVEVGLSDLAAGCEILAAAGFAATLQGERLWVDGAADAAEVTRCLAENGLYVNALIPVVPDLESVFLELTAGDSLSTSAPTESQPAVTR